MGNRLTKIYTRTGDGGTTGLGDGSRVAKDHARVQALGTVDELNSNVGLLLSEALDEDIRSCLTQIQHDLFDLGGELSIPGYEALREAQLLELERLLDQHNATLEPLKEFILPGGTRPAALCHVARTVCRRAERTIASLSAQQPVGPHALRYLNRLSDLLFVLARVLNRRGGGSDVMWRKDLGRPQGER